MFPAINPEFITYLEGPFARATRQVIAKKLQLQIHDIPTLRFDASVPDAPNNIDEMGYLGMVQKLCVRPEDHTTYAIQLNPSTITLCAQSNLARAGVEVNRLATEHNVSLEEMRLKLIQGAAFDLVVSTLLLAANSSADWEEHRTVRNLALKSLNLLQE